LKSESSYKIHQIEVVCCNLRPCVTSRAAKVKSAGFEDANRWRREGKRRWARLSCRHYVTHSGSQSKKVGMLPPTTRPASQESGCWGEHVRKEVFTDCPVVSARAKGKSSPYPSKGGVQPFPSDFVRMEPAIASRGVQERFDAPDPSLDYLDPSADRPATL